MTIKRQLASLCLVTVISTPIAAQAGDFEFSGFGSFILGMQDHTTQQPSEGYDQTHFTFQPDSLIGVQGNAQATDQLAWCLGRFRAPFYLYSDFLIAEGLVEDKEQITLGI